MDKLGFTEEVTWETEDAEKQFLYDKISQLKKKGFQSAMEQAEFKKMQDYKDSELSTKSQ